MLCAYTELDDIISRLHHFGLFKFQRNVTQLVSAQRKHMISKKTYNLDLQQVRISKENTKTY